MTHHPARWACGVALAVALAAPRAPAQSDGLVERGLRAYQDVEFATAATLLRRALASGLSDSERIQALVYLGAAEVFAGPQRRDSARAAFRRLALFDPRHRPDPLVFPPQVLAVYEDVRRTTKAVRVEAPSETSFKPAVEGGGLVVRLHATSSHEIEVRIGREDGTVVRTLYLGPVSDSLDVRWNGLDMDDGEVRSGRYVLSVASRWSLSGPVVRMVQLPLRVEFVAPDTLALLPMLPDSLLLPEHASRSSGIRPLATGLLASGAAIALPSLVADGTEPSGARFAVAGALSLVGIVGFVTEPGKVQRRHVAANIATRTEWQRRADSVRAENARRRDAARLMVWVGPATVIDSLGEGP
ncbi:MAG TPA: hypothetical protein VGU74_16705 [Gemmatimonadales bacterium]|nr:hypothetical protein [Gemmatimonadales bacterium]